MDWLRSALLAARMRAQHPTEPIAADEPEHHHEEPWEPAQEVTCETRATGKRDTNLSTPTLIVSNKTAGYRQCINHNGHLLSRTTANGPPGRPHVSVWIKEAFATAFKRRRYDFFRLGQARKILGTRIRLQFDNIGSGVSLFVPVNVPLTVSSSTPVPTSVQKAPPHTGTAASLQLVATDAKTGISPPDFADVSAAEPEQLAHLTVSGRSAYATYEVLDSDPNAIHEATISVYVAFISNTGQNLPQLGVTTIRTGFAPGPDVTVTEPSHARYSQSTPARAGYCSRS